MFESLGHYKILDRIGAGGMGEVYRARDTRLGRTVAIKVLAAAVADDPERRERFLREARAAAALSHPNIAALYEIGEDQGQLFLGFEFVPGETLRNVIAGRPLHPRRAVDFATQIADALAEAHAQGIVHRDIKSDNVIITPKDKAKILDFGLATWTTGGAQREQAADTTVMATETGTTLGTVAYMSPEQALGERVDHRTDIFSLGVVLFEMLTGTLPFKGNTATAVALQIVQATAPPPSSINRMVPPELDTVVARALAKSLDQRYESAATMTAELLSVAAILDVRAEISESSGVPSAAVTLPRRRSAFGWIVLALILAALAAAVWFQREPIRRLLRRAVGPAPAPVIAVIPLELAAADASETYFADGLTEDLITRLGQTPGLKVLGRSATRNYRGREPRDVARELGAGVVLTGSLRPSADTVKVSLELIDPADGAAIWSNQYTREVKDIFAVQAQVAGEVAQALRVKLQPTPSTARAASRLVERRAYESYLRGRQATSRRQLPEAMTFYQQAIAADAGLGEAHAGLAEALYLQGAFLGELDNPSQRERLRSAADRAYQLDPDLPEANVAMGLAADSLADALRYLRHAIELDPSHSDGYHLIGDQLHDFDPEQALAFFRRSLALDPRLDVNHTDIASVLALLGRHEEARRELEAIPRSGPGAGLAAGMSALVDLSEGRYAQAAAGMAALPNIRSAAPLWAVYAAALRLAGRTDDARSEADALVSRFPQSCQGRALLAALRLEHRDRAASERLAGPLLEAANRESPLQSDVRCGLQAAAAVQDGARAAGLLDRLAANELLLRPFSLAVMGQSGAMLLNPRTYPWSLVASQPVVVAAHERLSAAYTRQREIARSALSGLP